MADEEKRQPEEEQATQSGEKPKTLWQIEKESWYDKLPLTLKQLDTIVAVCWILIALVIVVIALDALNIFNPFGY